jgi:hypothetical protein
MADGGLPQAEADNLLAVEKWRIDQRRWDYPSLGGSVRIPLISFDSREHFFLDLYCGRLLNRAKVTYQNRVRQVIILARIDIGGPAPSNPDGEEVPCPRLHLYREGFGDRWAYPLPIDRFSNSHDL